jgi:nicotinamide phosphoribosyltransferase
MTNNIILNTDSYKASHFKQYPPGTEYVSSYIESRGGKYDETVFFGLQHFVKEVLTKPFTKEDIDEAEDVFTAHGVPFNRAGWEHIFEKHGGYLPLRIDAVPEGTVMANKNVMAQIVNTDPAVPWLTSYMETAILRAIWYPTTVATVSRECKKTIGSFLDETADNLQSLPFKLHDFGARGVSSQDSAAVGGMAHLVNFQGTDTVAALAGARRSYGERMAGYSIPAAEHSTITAWGRDGETAAYRNMLKQFGGEGKIVAVVSDSYDLWNAIDHIWGEELRDEVVGMGGTLVVRPDSGNPVEVVPKTITKLMKKFGFEINDKGYRVLPPFVRVIQGDGVSPETIQSILFTMKLERLSAENIAFGMGGELLQKVNRDTLKFAMKASAICINGQWSDVYKDPATDPGKASKKGRLALIEGADGKGFQTVREEALAQGQKNLLEPVFANGKLLRDQTLVDIRVRAEWKPEAFKPKEAKPVNANTNAPAFNAAA